MAKFLTPQQRNLLKGLAKGMSITDAARAAGYSDKYAGQVGSQALESIRRRMPELLDKHGLTDDALVENYLKPALEAMETEFAKFEGKITDSIDVIAWSPRLTALDMAFNLRGSYAQKEDLNVNGPIVIINHIPRPERA
jgi:phage terminase small subunit